MSSRYVSLAIDHGTTNSCIAQMTPQGPQVIPPESNNRILPSAVYYDKRGGLQVGAAARRAIMTTTSREGQGFTGYKLQIGGDMRYEFTAARKSMTAPELGAVIIQTLLRAHYQKNGVDAKACVITIPAKFKQNAVEGTRTAAEMAGLKYYPLIMEPVAAAMCYGFSAKEQHAEWMVFDLGGGTLDVSLVIARRGKLIVPDGGHAGDDNLGGSKFDRELAGYVLDQLEKKYKLTSFRQNRSKFTNEWGRLLLAVEEAKVRISSQPEAAVELPEPLCLDDQRKEVMVNVPVTRKMYEDLIRPDAERAVEICQMLLKNNRLPAREIERLILVGGPSKTPLIRQLLAERLGIPMESSVDPMTAVAEGAAIYADQVEIPEAWRASEVRTSEDFLLRMQYERQSPVPVYRAVGMIDGTLQDGMRVQVERLDGGWKSQEIAVDGSGVFTVELMLSQGQKPILSEFRTTLLDSKGRILHTANEPQIWYPSLGLVNRLANSLRVAIKGNQTAELVKPGAELPASGESEFLTTKALRRGRGGDVINIAVLESVSHLLGKEDRLASGCLHVGTLRILGSDERVTADLPVGSEIEVRLKVDESRAITAVAYVPLLDEQFETIFVGEKFEYEVKDLQNRLEWAKRDLAKVEKLQGERPVKEVGEVLESLERMKLVASVATDLERAVTGERDSEVRAYKRMLEIEGTIRALYALQNRARIEISVATLGGAVQGDEQRILNEIQREFSSVQSDEDLERVLASVQALEFTVRGQPWQILQLDLWAINGQRVTNHQLELFNKALKLSETIEAKGGLSKATDADIVAMQRMHRELEDAYPDLYKLRNEKLDEIRKEFPERKDLSDLELAGKAMRK